MFIHVAEWWAHPLAKLFTLVNTTGQIPEAWLNSIILPIFKKGNINSPGNYRPISLLPFIRKLYAKYLVNILSTWIHNNKLLGPEQIGFRKGSATLDHCVVLYTLIGKYLRPKRGKLFAAFIDLKSAFDLISRGKLWRKLADLNIEDHLLFLLKQLHCNNFCQVKYSKKGNLTDKIPINMGVKQGCILAPHLFNLFLSDLPAFMGSTNGHPPLVGNRPTPLLLYADDTIILSRTRIGLLRYLRRFIDYCALNHLIINFEKTKIVVFAKERHKYQWKVRGNSIEQVYHFKYLGVNFSYNNKWAYHLEKVAKSSKVQLTLLAKFFHRKGNRNILAAMKIYVAKIIPHLLFGSPIWIGAFSNKIEKCQSTFFRQLLNVPKCVANLTLLAELGQQTLESRAWLCTFKYWLKIHFHSPASSLLFHTLGDPNFTRDFNEVILHKLRCLGLDLSILVNYYENTVLNLISKRLEDQDIQTIGSSYHRVCSPGHWEIPWVYKSMPLYLHVLEDFPLKRAFLLARLNIFPSNFSSGRLLQIPRNERRCLHGCNVPDSLSHLLLNCSKFQMFHHSLGESMGELKYLCTDEKHLMKMLLSTKEPSQILELAKILLFISRTNLSLLQIGCTP